VRDRGEDFSCDIPSGTHRYSRHESAGTLNHYLQGIMSFLNWIERVGRIKANPLKHLPKIDERGPHGRVRRAFPDGEFGRNADFHALRYTWATCSQQNNIASMGTSVIDNSATTEPLVSGKRTARVVASLNSSNFVPTYECPLGRPVLSQINSLPKGCGQTFDCHG